MSTGAIVSVAIIPTIVGVVGRCKRCARDTVTRQNKASITATPGPNIVGD